MSEATPPNSPAPPIMPRAIVSNAAHVIAVDGPAGAGKSTVARRVAEQLGFTLLDTGALYRAVALAAERAGIAWSDAGAVGELCRALVAAGRLVVESLGEGHTGLRVLLDGVDPGDAMRTPAMSMGASTVSAIPAVRAALLDAQRNFATTGSTAGVVCEGRDIGTVVFPDAPLKIFLTASVDERARRRHRELADRGVSASLEQTRDEVMQRDAQDEGRAIAPLRRADDAVLLDSSDLDLEGTIARVVALARQRLPELARDHAEREGNATHGHTR